MSGPLSLSVAPMMDRTDRHFRYLMRLISPHARLYTEMITTSALLHGDRSFLLEFHPDEHPVAIQLGGNDPAAMAESATIAAKAGYDEININVGCPSGRVQAGKFGVRLMLEPKLVADCVAAIRAACDVPVTVKTRIGVDEHDDYEVLRYLTEQVVDAGAQALIVHARKAWLEGLSPKQNRNVPPLDYPRVYRLQTEFPELPISINGGFTTERDVLDQANKVHGVMLGRIAYQDPMLVGRLDRNLSASSSALTEVDVVSRYAEYMHLEIARGTRLSAMTRHLVGMFRHRPGARQWRQHISDCTESVQGIEAFIDGLASMESRSRYNARDMGDPAHCNARGMRS